MLCIVLRCQRWRGGPTSASRSSCRGMRFCICYTISFLQISSISWFYLNGTCVARISLPSHRSASEDLKLQRQRTSPSYAHVDEALTTKTLSYSKSFSYSSSSPSSSSSGSSSPSPSLSSLSRTSSEATIDYVSFMRWQWKFGEVNFVVSWAMIEKKEAADIEQMGGRP